MRILIFSWRGPGHPHAGGAEVSTHEHAKGWVAAGHHVTLFTSFYPGAKKEEIIDGVNIKRRGIQIFGVHLEAVKWYLFSPHPQYDIVIDQFHGIPFFTPFYVRQKKLCFIHEVTKEVWRLNPWPWPFNLVPTIIGTIFEPLMFLLYKNISFMTVSKSTKDDLINWGIPKDNITVIHNGLTIPKIKKNFPKEKKKTAIFLGALSRDKGAEDALDAFGCLFKMSQDMQFWVVGKGERHYLEHLRRKVSLLGITKVTKFFGFVSEREKYELLSKAHILINPSIREGWGFVVIEAASRGTPTVAYKVAGLKDSVVDGKTGLLCEVNPERLSEKIQYLLGNKQLYDFLCKNCLSWSKKFSWSDSVRQSLKLLQKISKK